MAHITPVRIPAHPPDRDSTSAALDLDRLHAVQAFNARLVCMTVDESTYEEVVEGVWRVIGCDSCALFLHDPARNRLELKSAVGYEDLPAGLTISCADLGSAHAQAFREEYVVHLENLADNRAITTLSSDLGSNLVLPVIANRGPVGVFDFGWYQSADCSDQVVSMCTMLVDQMAYSLENIRLVRELSSSRDAVIRGMALLSEIRDSHISGHLNRICALARYLAERLVGRPGYQEVTPEFLDTIERSAALHDVGKVGIPDSILLKPDKLTPAEFEIMKSHPTIGGQILRGLIEDFGSYGLISMGAEVAQSHHEWWDGTGYPNGLRERGIPLAARIVALCDVYDALASMRVYKGPWDHDTILETITGLGGRQFDPELTQVFLEQPADLLAISAEFPD